MLLSEIIMNFPVETKTTTFPSANSEKMNRLKKVLEYIDQHFREKLTIKELGLIIQLSEGHLSRFFKSLVQMTPIDYINTIRINKAAKLLKETDHTILEISLEVGFDNTSYFIRTFKRQKNVRRLNFERTSFHNLY
ncbi:helix-turn-helix transcriptional regulator [Halalkalibacter kiskunsagensis]|uniref:Helix-turn-helix transcriptional regulator n=1 Tax=Halalkalibacter kiskunsagensis TaxID=1548599 RepID=A0ABV6K953_9BACI